MLRTGFVDTRIAYTAEQLRWVFDPAMPSGDVIAVRDASEGGAASTWNAKSGGY